MLAGFVESPHRRWNPLRREWVLVSPHRTQRPWQGQTEEKSDSKAPEYDPACYLCPGNLRAGGHQTPSYTGTYVFENRGAMMGASNPHPHGQIWATEHIPNEPSLELASQRDFFDGHGSSLLLNYLQLELRQAERIVAQTEFWVALVPFWAVWPFELLLLPKCPLSTLRELDLTGRNGLAEMLQRITAGYNRVFDTPFPYSMGFHPAPCDSGPHPEWQLHAHFYPPLLRSATVRKFMVGFELLGSPQRDITPESAALTLRNAIEQQS